MDLTVDEDDRDVLRPSRHELRVGGDVVLDPVDSDVARDARDDCACIRTQVTAGPGQDDDSCRRPVGHNGVSVDSRSRPLATLPVTECGSSSTNSTDVGHLNLARRAAAWSMTSRAVSEVPSRTTTRALTVSPVYGWGMPSTATSA